MFVGLNDDSTLDIKPKRLFIGTKLHVCVKNFFSYVTVTILDLLFIYCSEQHTMLYGGSTQLRSRGENGMDVFHLHT
jgi:hypothetical protein